MDSSESCFTDTLKAVNKIYAGSSIKTRKTVTLIDF